MATLVAIGYPDQTTAEEARQTVQQLEAELIIQADQVASISRDLGWVLGIVIRPLVLHSVRGMGGGRRTRRAVWPSRRERD